MSLQVAAIGGSGGRDGGHWPAAAAPPWSSSSGRSDLSGPAGNIGGTDDSPPETADASVAPIRADAAGAGAAGAGTGKGPFAAVARFGTCGMLVAAVAAAAAALVGIVAVAALLGTGTIRYGGGGGVGDVLPSNPSNASVPIRTEQQYRERYERYRSAVLTWGGTDPGNLADSFSPQSRALAWLVTKDGALPPTASDERVLQRYAVMATYYACGGDGWAGFVQPLELQTDKSECLYRGVTCDDEGRVSRVEWYGTNLVGELPDEIGILTGLTHLDLSANRLQGTIPDAVLTKLTNLETLFLNANEFASTLSSEVTNLVKLEQLDIGSNLLTGPLPSSIAKLSAMKNLSLAENAFTGPFFPLLASWPNLEHLWADNTRLSGTIPESVGDAVPGLVTFSVPNTLLSGTIPPSFAELTKLSTVSFVCPGLNSSLLVGFGQLTELTSLDFSESAGTGTFPTELGLLTKLTSLTVAYNPGLHGPVPDELGNLVGLKSLILTQTDLTGTLPESLGRATQLESIEILKNPGMSGELDFLCPVANVYYDCVFSCDCCSRPCIKP